MHPKIEKRLSEIAAQNLPNNGGDPDRNKILALNQTLRNERTNTDLGHGLGYLALNIPVPDMRVLELRFPDLMSRDPEIKLKAWQKFIASPHSEPYKVRRNDGKRVQPKGIIVR